MARKKLKFNKKLLNRFSKKELMKRIKLDKIPLEMPVSKYSKGEVVVYLLRLQRSKLYYDFFDKLEIKPPREMSAKQKENAARFSNNLRKVALVNKQKVPQSAKIDVKKDIQIGNKETIATLNIKTIDPEAALLQVKGGGFVPDDLESLFVFLSRCVTC